MLDAVSWDALRLSLLVACTATLVALPIALWVAWLLVRGQFRGKALLSALVHLPLVLPPVVTGYLLLIGFGRNGPIGGFLYDVFGITLAFRWTGAVLAAVIMGFPKGHARAWIAFFSLLTYMRRASAFHWSNSRRNLMFAFSDRSDPRIIFVSASRTKKRASKVLGRTSLW